MITNLQTPIDKLHQIGPGYSKKLEKFGIKKVEDLLYHFPFRYDDFRKISPIEKLKTGQVATICGKILEIENSRSPRRRMVLTEAIIEDSTGPIKATWFNQPFLTNSLKKGQTVYLSGKVVFAYDILQLSNPTYEIKGNGATTHTGRIVPVYPETVGLTSRWLRFQIKSILPLVDKIKDFLPSQIKENQDLIDLPVALKQIHFPRSWQMMEKARQRLAFDELFLIQLFVLKEKKKWQSSKAYQIPFNQELVQNFTRGLSFQLTNAQRKAGWQILQDLAKDKPMNRLLEGDVGSGKTVVATMAALETAKAGYQTAFMAPTEILAQQHFKEMSNLLKDFNFKIGLLTGSENKIWQEEKTSRVKFKEEVSRGNIDVLIGTHALIGLKNNSQIKSGVKFKNLALAIIDEQHRFGVEQRAALQEQSALTPHLLTMTATPIPRTLALTVYGDLDISLLDEMPKGRQKIITKIVAPADREKAYQFIKDQIKAGRQIFVICPLIEESEKLQVKAATEEHKKLSQDIFPDLKIALLHGRLKSAEKEQVIKDFKARELDILVSTSVVEVGIDIPNASVIMIEGAERFGLAQLHQLRGRVGRSSHQSYCFLFTDSSAKKTNQRLKAILKSANGFELAEKDLAIRGPGQFYGTRQSGLPDLAMANLNDLELIQKVRQEADIILKKDLFLRQYPQLAKKLEIFQKNLHFE